MMSDEEIKTFITTFKQFMKHADVEEMNYLRRESTRKYKQLYYQNQAKKHNVSYDYYISEFTLRSHTMSRKYRVEQYFTTGWSIVDKDAIKLSKDQAKKILENLMKEGVNPNELRAIPD